jgi:hypothetical protein
VKPVVTPPTDDSKLEAIFNNLKPKMDAANPTFDYSLNVDPLLKDSQWTKDSIASINSAKKLLTVLGVTPPKKLQIYLTWGPEYAAPFLPDYCQAGTGGGGYCGQTGKLVSNIKWFINNWGYGETEKPYKSEMDKFIVTANVPHEIGHFGQDSTATSADNPDYWRYQPAWLREGGAEYFKFLAYAYDNKVTYKHLHDLYLASGVERCLNVPLVSESPDGCEYTKGLFAIEYLVLKTGNPNAIFAMAKTNGTDTASIFKSTYGFTLADFAKEADAYFAKVVAAKGK